MNSLRLMKYNEPNRWEDLGPSHQIVLHPREVSKISQSISCYLHCNVLKKRLIKLNVKLSHRKI